MEEVLHSKAVRRGCFLEKNNLGLYDIKVKDENGVMIEDVRNITFLRAVSILEEQMYQSGRESKSNTTEI